MIAFIVFVLIHVLLFGAAVFAAKLAEHRYIIEDSDMAIIMAIFLLWVFSFGSAPCTLPTKPMTTSTEPQISDLIADLSQKIFVI